MGALVSVRGVHAWPDQRNLEIGTSAQSRFAIGAIAWICIHFVGNRMVGCQSLQLPSQAQIVRPARIFRANPHAKLIRALSLADGSHIHRHQFLDIVRDAHGTTVTDFLVIRDQHGHTITRRKARLVQREQRPVPYLPRQVTALTTR